MTLNVRVEDQRFHPDREVNGEPLSQIYHKQHKQKAQQDQYKCFAFSQKAFPETSFLFPFSLSIQKTLRSYLAQWRHTGRICTIDYVPDRFFFYPLFGGRLLFRHRPSLL